MALTVHHHLEQGFVCAEQEMDQHRDVDAGGGILAKPQTFWPLLQYFIPILCILAKPIATALPKPQILLFLPLGKLMLHHLLVKKWRHRTVKQQETEDTSLSSSSLCLCLVTKFSFHQPSSPEIIGRE